MERLCHGLRPLGQGAGRPPPTALVIARLGMLQQPLPTPFLNDLAVFEHGSTAGRKPLAIREVVGDVKISSPAQPLLQVAQQASTSACTFASKHATLSSQSSTFGLQPPGRGRSPPRCCGRRESWRGRPVLEDSGGAQPHRLKPCGGQGRASLGRPGHGSTTESATAFAHGMGGLRQAEWVLEHI